jgi:alpha-beta hydrolase superfamily lysophospholipase
MRIGLWLLLLFAVLSTAALVYDWIRFTRSMPDRGWNAQVIRLVGLFCVNLLFAGVLAAIGLLFFWGRAARSLPDLQPWHLQKPKSEFRSADAVSDYTLDDYLEQEACVFQELDDLIVGGWAKRATAEFSRFNSQSGSNPKNILDHNWNRSLVMQSPNPLGGVLLLHGLSDSPYSLRAMGRRLHAEGYTVVWLRLPGHGTAPSALADVTWKDWTAAVSVAMQGLRDLLPAGSPLILAGYSNGGALSIDYAISAIDHTAQPRPSAIVLFSPMIGINALARVTRLYHTVAMVFRNRKAQWQSINAEIDPFKYSSWPMNANVQAWAMTQAVERKLAKLQASGRIDQMPPVLAMQSVVDATVVVPKLITNLFDRLNSEFSELFLFDVNRSDRLSNLVNLSFEQSVVPKLSRTDRPFRLSVLTNAQSGADHLTLKTRAGNVWAEESLAFRWPEGTVSLSHLAVPIGPDDPIYGAHGDNAHGLSLGTLSMRAEPGALMISTAVFVRCRNNPFYHYMEDRVVAWLSAAVN